MVISHSDNIVLMWLSRQPELQKKKGDCACVGGWDESVRILWKCSGMRWVYLHVRRCVRVWVCVWDSVWEKERNETAGRAIHLFFLVEALSVAVGYAETSRVEHVADFKTAQDALHLPPTRPLATWQAHPRHQHYTLILTQSQTWRTWGVFMQLHRFMVNIIRVYKS